MSYKGHLLINVPKDELKKDMLDKYIQLSKNIDKVPNSRDIVKYSKLGDCYSMTSYIDHFGSLYNIQRLCNLTPTRIGNNKTKKQMIEDLIKLYDLLNRVPTVIDLKDCNFISSRGKYYKEFGGFENALEEAGIIKTKKKTILSPKGEKCYSYLELKFILMLEKYNIQYNKEEKYNKYIVTDLNYRFDYTLNINSKKYFIEIFGIEGSEEYDRVKDNKINLCNTNNLTLLQFTYRDLWNKNEDEIYNILKRKMQEEKDKYKI